MGIGRWDPGVISQAAQQETGGLERLGGGLGTFAEDEQRRTNALQLAQANGEAHAGLIAAHGQLPGTTDPTQLMPGPNGQNSPAMNSVSNIINQARAKISDPSVAAQFDAEIQPHIAQYGAASLARGRDSEPDRSRRRGHEYQFDDWFGGHARQ
jgi:hypothetical protein